MAQTPITGIPGVVTDPNKYPQWGVTQSGDRTQRSTYHIAEARNAADKNRLLQKNYDVWLVSQQAAESFIGTEITDAKQGKIGDALNPLSGLAAIGDFFHRLAEGNTWIRIGEGLLGIILIALGIARMTHAVPVATQIAKAVAV